MNVGTLTMALNTQISSGSSLQVGDRLFVGSGDGGNIDIQVQGIDVSHGGTISARNSGPGDAGNIVTRLVRPSGVARGAVTTEVETSAGGNITLRVGSLAGLRDRQLTATVRSGVAQGGNISIVPQAVVLRRSQVGADTFGKLGGNVRIVAEVLLEAPDSRVSAASALGIAGTVEIQAQVATLSGLVAPLPPEFTQVAALRHDPCVARLREGTASSLVEHGRAGVTASPEGILPSQLHRESPRVSKIPR